MAASQRPGRSVENDLVGQIRVDAPEHDIPELVAAGQQHLEAPHGRAVLSRVAGGARALAATRR
jgi:hypothetical protein